jgi:hypothetical protein
MSAPEGKDRMMPRTWIRQAVVVLGLTALGCLAGSCKEKTPCDEGQVLRDAFCWYVDASPTDVAAPALGGEAGPAGGEDASPAGGAEVFGRPCVTDAECAAPATLCAPQIFYCTTFGCDVDPAICPAGWTCMDLTPFGRAAHMCFKG